MDDMRSPVAYSLRFYEKQLICANRFLGLPNAFWAAVIIAAISMGLWWHSGQPLLSFAKEHIMWLLAGWGALWGLFRCVTPGRARLKRIAEEEHRAEVIRVALAHSVNMQDVNLVNSTKEHDRLSGGTNVPSAAIGLTDLQRGG